MRIKNIDKVQEVTINFPLYVWEEIERAVAEKALYGILDVLREKMEDGQE